MEEVTLQFVQPRNPIEEALAQASRAPLRSRAAPNTVFRTRGGTSPETQLVAH